MRKAVRPHRHNPMDRHNPVGYVIGFPSIRRPNSTYKVFGNSFIIAYLGQIRRVSSVWGSVRIKREMLTKL